MNNFDLKKEFTLALRLRSGLCKAKAESLILFPVWIIFIELSSLLKQLNYSKIRLLSARSSTDRIPPTAGRSRCSCSSMDRARRCGRWGWEFDSPRERMSYLTYVLKSIKINSYYIGSTNNIEKRLIRHNSGQVISTKRYKAWKLVYLEEFDTLREARSRETRIKSYKAGEAFKKLIRQNGYWRGRIVA